MFPGPPKPERGQKTERWTPKTGTRAQNMERRCQKPERGHIRQNHPSVKPPFLGARQRSGEGVVRRNGCPRGCFWTVRFFSAPSRFSGPFRCLKSKPQGGREETDSPKTPFWITVSPHDPFAAPLARPDFVQQTRVYPYPLVAGSARPNPKMGAPDPENPLLKGFSVPGEGLRPWSQTMVSEGARPWGRGRSGDYDLFPLEYFARVLFII